MAVSRTSSRHFGVDDMRNGGGGRKKLTRIVRLGAGGAWILKRQWSWVMRGWNMASCNWLD